MVMRLSTLFKKKLAEPPLVEREGAQSSNENGLAIPSADEDLRFKTEGYIAALRQGEYDFVDLGTCDGGGFTIAARQGGRKGLGFDLEPAFVRQALARGIDVALYDVCDLTTEAACVDFAVCSHILEHLPSLTHIERVLRSLRKLCRDYLIISGPVFDDEDYLEALGIKALHSLMRDHTCKLRVDQLQAVLHAIGCRDYLLALTEPIPSSLNHWLYNAEQPVPDTGLWTYDVDKHLPKPTIEFDRPLHRDFVCVVPTREGVPVDDILSKFYWGYDKIVHRATWYD